MESIIPEIRFKVFEHLDNDTKKSVRLVCKDWLSDIEESGLIYPSLDDRSQRSLGFYKKLNNPQALIVHNLNDKNYTKIPIPKELKTLRCSGGVDLLFLKDFSTHSKFLTTVKLDGYFFQNEHLLGIPLINSEKLLFPVLKTLHISQSKEGIMNDDPSNFTWFKENLSPRITTILTNITILLNAINAPKLIHLQYENEVRKSKPHVDRKFIEQIDEEVVLLDFIRTHSKSLKKLEICLPVHIASVPYQSNQIISLESVEEISLIHYDAVAYGNVVYSLNSDYFWCQVVGRQGNGCLRKLTYQSYHLFNSFTDFKLLLKNNITLEEVYFTGRFLLENQDQNVPFEETRGSLKSVGKFNCSIFSPLTNLKKLKLHILNPGGFTVLFRLKHLPVKIQELVIVDTFIPANEFEQLQRLEDLRLLEYENNCHNRAVEYKQLRVTIESFQHLLQIRSLNNLCIKPVFSPVALKKKIDKKPKKEPSCFRFLPLYYFINRTKHDDRKSKPSFLDCIENIAKIDCISFPNEFLYEVQM